MMFLISVHQKNTVNKHFLEKTLRKQNQNWGEQWKKNGLNGEKNYPALWGLQ